MCTRVHVRACTHMQVCIHMCGFDYESKKTTSGVVPLESYALFSLCVCVCMCVCVCVFICVSLCEYRYILWIECISQRTSVDFGPCLLPCLRQHSLFSTRLSGP